DADAASEVRAISCAALRAVSVFMMFLDVTRSILSDAPDRVNGPRPRTIARPDREESAHVDPDGDRRVRRRFSRHRAEPPVRLRRGRLRQLQCRTRTQLSAVRLVAVAWDAHPVTRSRQSP